MEANCTIALLHSDLLSTLFSFNDFRTSTCALRLVCKAWRDACDSPLAFAAQRLILTHPAAAVQWAHCFTLVKCIDVRCDNHLEFAKISDALTPHLSRVQRLKISIQRSVYMTPFSRALTRFSESFQKLTHIKLVVRLPNDEDQKDDNSGKISRTWKAFDDTEFLLSFSKHFPHIASLRFVNMYGQHLQMLEAYDIGYVPPKEFWAHPQALIRSLPSLPSLTSLRWASCFELTSKSCDDLLRTISRACPKLQDFRMAPGSISQFTADGVRALADGCPRLNSIGVRLWRRLSPSDIDTLLCSLPNMHTLDLRSSGRDDMDSYCCSLIGATELAAVLAAHPHVTRLVIDDSQPSRMFWSSIIRDVTIFRHHASVSNIAHYMSLIPQVRNVTVRASSRVYTNVAQISVEDILYLRAKYPRVERLVWQRDLLTDSDPCKSEEVYRAETGDPKTYRVVFYCSPRSWFLL